MGFEIRALNPRANGEHDEDDENLNGALQTAFPSDTDDAILEWNGISVPLSYKYDVSFIIDDLIPLLRDILDHETGKRVIHWPSNTFAGNWTLSWDAHELRIESDWRSEMGALGQRLNQSGELHVPRLAFVAEWREVFGHVLRALEHSGYAGLPLMDELRRLYDEMPLRA